MERQTQQQSSLSSHPNHPNPSSDLLPPLPPSSSNLSSSSSNSTEAAAATAVPIAVTMDDPEQDQEPDPHADSDTEEVGPRLLHIRIENTHSTDSSNHSDTEGGDHHEDAAKTNTDNPLPRSSSGGVVGASSSVFEAFNDDARKRRRRERDGLDPVVVATTAAAATASVVAQVLASTNADAVVEGTPEPLSSVPGRGVPFSIPAVAASDLTDAGTHTTTTTSNKRSRENGAPTEIDVENDVQNNVDSATTKLTLEEQIQRELGTLDDIERRQVQLDIHGSDMMDLRLDAVRRQRRQDQQQQQQQQYPHPENRTSTFFFPPGTNSSGTTTTRQFLEQQQAVLAAAVAAGSGALQPVPPEQQHHDMTNTSFNQEAELLSVETEALGHEITRLLEDPREQQQNPVYRIIAAVLNQDEGFRQQQQQQRQAHHPQQPRPMSCFYTNSIAFRIKMLRAEHYVVKKAAKRSVMYLCLLYETFGNNDDVLKRPIRLADLSPKERGLQRKGYQQLFRFRDQSSTSTATATTKRMQQQFQLTGPPQQYSSPLPSSSPQHHYQAGAGRRIAGSFDLCRCTSTSEPALDDEVSKLRAMLYLMQVASDDEETQKQGLVFIFMLALRALLGGNHSISTPALSSLATTSGSGPPERSVLQNQKPPYRSPSSASLPATAAANAAARNITSHTIFATTESLLDSTTSAKASSDHSCSDPAKCHPHDANHRHNHTLRRIRILSKAFRCGPVRVGTIHVCSPNRTELQHIKFDLLQALDKQDRARTRFHNGTSMECSISLNRSGIPTDRLPLKYDGTIKTEDHLQWIAIQEAKESSLQQNRKFEPVECPMNMDILSGRGQLVRSHPGNVSFRTDFIRARSSRYDAAANREQKNAIAVEILQDIANLKRRFLKQHPGAGYWTELDTKTAKEKVMMAFREYRKSQRNQQQAQQDSQIQRRAKQKPQQQFSSSSLSHDSGGNTPAMPLSQEVPSHNNEMFPHYNYLQPPRQQDVSTTQSPHLLLEQYHRQQQQIHNQQYQQPCQYPSVLDSCADSKAASTEPMSASSMNNTSAISAAGDGSTAYPPYHHYGLPQPPQQYHPSSSYPASQSAGGQILPPSVPLPSYMSNLQSPYPHHFPSPSSHHQSMHHYDGSGITPTSITSGEFGATATTHESHNNTSYDTLNQAAALMVGGMGGVSGLGNHNGAVDQSTTQTSYHNPYAYVVPQQGDGGNRGGDIDDLEQHPQYPSYYRGRDNADGSLPPSNRY